MNYDPVLARAILERTPRVVRAMLAGLPSEWLDAPEGPGAWSPRDVVCHLADLEHDAWLPRLRTILEHGRGRPLRAVERERFRLEFHGVPLEVVLDEFATVRDANLQDVNELVADDRALAMHGRHPDFGDVEVGQLLATWVVHDLTHLTQISRTLAVQYRDAVGPWREYLSVLAAKDS